MPSVSNVGILTAEESRAMAAEPGWVWLKPALGLGNPERMSESFKKPRRVRGDTLLFGCYDRTGRSLFSVSADEEIVIAPDITLEEAKEAMGNILRELVRLRRA